MSIRAIQAVWDRSRLKGSKRLLLVAIADNANEDSFDAWPSLETLAKKTALDRRYVIQMLGEISDTPETYLQKIRDGIPPQELITWHSKGGRYNETSIYHVNLPGQQKPGKSSVFSGDPLNPKSFSTSEPGITPPVIGGSPHQGSGDHPTSEPGITPPVIGGSPKPSKNRQRTVKEPSLATPAGKAEDRAATRPQERAPKNHEEAPAMNPGTPLTPEQQEIWNALSRNFGGDPRTENERTKRLYCVRQLAGAHATEAQIRRAYRRHYQIWPQAHPTPNSLVKHWSMLLDNRTDIERFQSVPLTTEQQKEIEHTIHEETRQELTAEQRKIAEQVQARHAARKAARDDQKGVFQG